MDNEVLENTAASRFELSVGDEMAVAYYRYEDGRYILTHTEVPQALSGQGMVRASRKAFSRCFANATPVS